MVISLFTYYVQVQILRYGISLPYMNELYIFSLAALSEGFRTMDSYDKKKKLLEEAQAMADLKFTYVVSCQVYGSQKKSKNTRDRNCYTNILNLMLT